ncbi:MAG: nucleotidyltransferase domain-containing protein [Anaerolineales bacterium]|nr:nucleotidyltransferase domain-containing protein [Anaerolineales bacterium]
MDKIKIRVHRKQIEDFCRRNNIKKLAFFGSVLRDDFNPQSDVDVLVEFEGDKTPGFAFFDLQEELKGLFNREVDLHTFRGVEASRNPYRRRAILDSAQVYYVA